MVRRVLAVALRDLCSGVTCDTSHLGGLGPVSWPCC